MNVAWWCHYNLLQLPELAQFSVGLMHIQLLHTSASLAINENWDPDVRDDMEMMLNRIVPEDVPFRHSCEGPDDMVSKYLGFNSYFDVLMQHIDSNINIYWFNLKYVFAYLECKFRNYWNSAFSSNSDVGWHRKLKDK